MGSLTAPKRQAVENLREGCLALFDVLYLLLIDASSAAARATISSLMTRKPRASPTAAAISSAFDPSLAEMQMTVALTSGQLIDRGSDASSQSQGGHSARVLAHGPSQPARTRPSALARLALTIAAAASCRGEVVGVDDDVVVSRQLALDPVKAL